MKEYSKEKIKAELHEKYENGEIDDVELEERLFALEDVPDEKLDYFAELGKNENKSDELIIPNEGLEKIRERRSIVGTRFAENKDLQEKLNLTILFISHDLPVIRQMCDRIAVLKNGQLCEVTNTEDLFIKPSHEYTKELLRLMPKIESIYS